MEMVFLKQTITWISMFILITGASTSDIDEPLKKGKIIVFVYFYLLIYSK